MSPAVDETTGLIPTLMTGDTHWRGRTAPVPILEGAQQALEFEAPFLIEKLLKERLVDSAAEGEALFTEVKRYMVLVGADESLGWDMHSLRVDDAWHQFILFTQQYTAYCQRHFGRYVHHSPSNAPEMEGAMVRESASFALFCERYEQLFGLPLPAIWDDAGHVAPVRRVVNESAGSLTLREADGTIELVTAHGDVLAAVNEFARDALAFVAQTGAFYVRELPGGLTDGEKTAFISTLVAHRILRVTG